MIIFYSGEENTTRPEVVLKDKANIMLSYIAVVTKTGKITERFRRIVERRNNDHKQERISIKTRKRRVWTKSKSDDATE